MIATFEVEIFELEAREPGRLNLKVFFDDDQVDTYLHGEEVSEIDEQVELILSTLEVEEADVYALSTASVLEIYADMHACGNINLCLIHILKAFTGVPQDPAQDNPAGPAPTMRTSQ